MKYEREKTFLNIVHSIIEVKSVHSVNTSETRSLKGLAGT